jgi:predicted RNA methylase
MINSTDDVITECKQFGVSDKNPKELDQYFTKPDVADKCIDQLQSILSVPLTGFNSILEPSSGEGAFVSSLKSRGISEEKLVYVDIDAKDEAHRRDFLKANVAAFVKNESQTFVTIGNPPFGKNSSTAVAFFNRAAEFSDVIAFILPRTFRKESVQKKLNDNFHLIHDNLLDKNSFTFQGKDYDVPCVFQIWCRGRFASYCNSMVSIPANGIRVLKPHPKQTNDFKFVKASESPDFAIRRVGVNAGRIFTDDPESKSESSHLFVKLFDNTKYSAVFEQLKSLKLESSECKYDTAGNPSLTQGEICTIYNNKVCTGSL